MNCVILLGLNVFLVGGSDHLMVRAQSAGQPASREYEFRIREKTPVILARVPFFYEGHLDANGYFILDPKAKVVEMPRGADVKWIDDLGKRKAPIFNRVPRGNGASEVYQYISGDWLIFGSIPGEDFLPGIKNRMLKVISMEEYLRGYDPQFSPPIYNLPGSIVPKKNGKR